MKQLHDSPGRPSIASTSLDRLFELAEVLGGIMERGVAERGLTRARAGLLWALFHEGPVTQRALARTLGVTPRNVTGLLDALERDGQVARHAHPGDRRAVLVSLTARGRRTVTALREGRDQLAELLFAGMPDDRVDAVRGALETVIDRLRAAEAGGAHENR